MLFNRLNCVYLNLDRLKPLSRHSLFKLYRNPSKKVPLLFGPSASPPYLRSEKILWIWVPLVKWNSETLDAKLSH